MLRRNPPSAPAATTANTKNAQNGLLVPSVNMTTTAPRKTSIHAVIVARRWGDRSWWAMTQHTHELYARWSDRTASAYGSIANSPPVRCNHGTPVGSVGSTYTATIAIRDRISRHRATLG